MNLLLQPLGPWSAALGWLALEVAVIVLAALAAEIFLRGASARRSLWRAVLTALPLLLAAELTGATSQLSAQLRTAWQTAFTRSAPPQLPPSSTPEHSFTPPPASSLAPIGGEGRGEGEASTGAELLEPQNTLPAFLWLTGLVALLARSAWTHAGFAWLRLRHFLPAAEALRQRVQALAARLGLRRRVRVLASERLRAPAAFGWVRPGLGVPGDFTDRFAPAQQDVMLAHELAHLAARDPLWQLLADLTVAMFWWHPLAWWARHQLRASSEQVADEASLACADGPVTLAECLLVLGRETVTDPRAALGMAGFRSQLGRRVERLLALPRRDWQAPSRARLALQTAVALLALAALALLPGCAANRSAGEAPSHIVAQWWQTKTKTPENQPRGATLLVQAKPQPKPVLIQGRVLFNGTPPPEQAVWVPPQLAGLLKTKANDLDQQRKAMLADHQRAEAEYKRLIGKATDSDLNIQEREQLKRAAEAKLLELQKVETTVTDFDRDARRVLSTMQKDARLMTRNHIRSPDGGLADVLVYVKHGLEGQTFAPTTNTHLIRIQRYEYHPYITAVQAGQLIRWESDVSLNFHPTPTNAANREFNRVLDPGRPVEATFTAPEFFLRTKDDIHPWLFGYVSVLPHPFFAVTDAEGRFRFPRPLPPGKYTLAALHRRAGERTQDINLTTPLPAGEPLEVQFTFSAPPIAPAASVAQIIERSTTAVEAAQVSPAREELLRAKARIEVDLKSAAGIYLPKHPRMIGLRKQLESVEEALKQAAPPTPKPGASLQPVPVPVGDDVRRLTSPQTPDAKPQTPPASQRLVTSSPTSADGALGQTRPANAVTPTPFSMQVAVAQALLLLERMLAMEKLLGEAGQFQKIKSWTNAVVRYEEGLLLAPPLNGPAGAPRQVTDAIAGLNYCRLQLAIEHKQRSEFAQATELVEKVLALDPANDFARLIKQLVERVSKPTPSAAAVSVDAADQAKAERLIASTRLRLDQNNTRDALQNLWAALLTNPRSDADSSLLLLLLDKRFEDERMRLAGTLSGQRGLPVPNPYYRTNSQVPFLTHSSKGAQRINRKLEEIVLPEVHFDGVPLAEVMSWLSDAAKRHDPERKGLNFLINSMIADYIAGTTPAPATQPKAGIDLVLIRVHPPLKDLTLRHALDVITKSAELPIKFSVEEYGIVISVRGPANPAFFSRLFRVNPDTFLQGLQGVVSNPVTGVGVGVGRGNSTGAGTVARGSVPGIQRTNSTAEANELVRQLFRSAGVSTLGATNGARAFYIPANGLLLAHGTTNDLQLIEQVLQKVQLPVAPPTNREPPALERKQPGRIVPTSTNAPGKK